MSERLYSLIMASCPERDLRSGELDANCAELLRRMGREIGGYFAYDLYDECYVSKRYDERCVSFETGIGTGV